jgi:hypothetical protein
MALISMSYEPTDKDGRFLVACLNALSGAGLGLVVRVAVLVLPLSQACPFAYAPRFAKVYTGSSVFG